ncbi:hypothetical protein BS47DRAFT_1357716 [Hydnum rufescens UP504]|uniref:Uncharacterized protein n=1 Tax=Hydnum rufescens UP504 TaxID=1448309 RepID=A0A9P6BBW7_9AGAM|nr:hypothetical protein BS47DRAFT_1357716 [Hydnum rufescens UP504]
MDIEPAVDTPALTTDPIHYFGFKGEEGYSSEEPSDDDFAKKCQHQSVKDQRLEEAQRDPHWAAVTTDFPMAFLGIPGPREHILSIVQEAQKKRRVYCSGLEHYVLERWSSAPPGPPGYPKHAKNCHRSVNADQGPIDRPKSAQHEAEYGPSRGWSQSCSPVWGEEYLESEHNHAECNCAEHDCAECDCAERNHVERDCIERDRVEHNRAFASFVSCPSHVQYPPTLVQGRLFDVHSPPLVPHVFPTWVLAILWVLLAIVHGLVIITHTLLAIVCHLSITHILVNVASSPHIPPPDRDFPLVQGLHHDWPEPENAMLEDQAPEAQTVSQLPGPVSSDHDHDTSMQVDVQQVGLLVSPKDSPIIPLSEFNDLAQESVTNDISSMATCQRNSHIIAAALLNAELQVFKRTAHTAN